MLKQILLTMASVASFYGQATQNAIFQCPGGETIRASITAARAVVTVAGKGTVSLKKETSGSGAKYSDGFTIFWEKGGVAMLEAGSGKLVDCKKTVSSSVASPLTGKWTLVELQGKAVKAAKPAFVEFAADGKRVSGSLGCNRFTGSFTHDGQRLSFGPLAGTKMACIGEGAQIEKDFSMALRETQRLQIFEGQLTLMDEMGTKLAVLKRN